MVNLAQERNTQYTRQIIQTGLFLALALILRKFLTYTVFIGGAPGMRITFAGVFGKLPALLFGPVIGGTASGLLDILGFIMDPQGAYIPWLTVTSILNGVMIGLLWKLLKDINIKKVQKGFFIFFTLVGLIGILNHIYVLFYSNSSWAKALGSIGKSRDFATIGLEITALIGIGLFILDIFVEKRQQNLHIHKNFLKLLIVTGIAGITVTTINTYILQIFIPALAKKGFLLFWIPRLLQEIFMVVLQAYVVAFLLSIYEKFQKHS
jgi:ECF transporter S component (folate family)